MNNVLKTDKIHLSKQTPTFGIIMLLRYCLAKVYMSCNETLVVITIRESSFTGIIYVPIY